MNIKRTLPVTEKTVTGRVPSMGTGLYPLHGCSMIKSTAGWSILLANHDGYTEAETQPKKAFAVSEYAKRALHRVRS